MSVEIVDRPDDPDLEEQPFARGADVTLVATGMWPRRVLFLRQVKS